MSIRDIIKRSGRSLRSAKGRTLLTALAIAVGGFTLTLTLSAARGAKAYTDRIVSSNFDPAELLVAKDDRIFSASGSTKPIEYDESIGESQGFSIKRIDRSDIDKIQVLPGVEEVREGYQINLQYVTRGGNKRYTGMLEVYNRAQKPEIAAGALSDNLPARSVLLPDEYLDLLGFKSAEDAVSKQITLQVQQPFGKVLSEPFTIAAVTKKPATSISFVQRPLLAGRDDVKMLSDFVNAGTVNADKFIYVSVRVKDGLDKTKLKAVQDQLKSMGYNPQSVEDTQKFLGQIISVLQGIVLGFGSVTLIASFFGVVNTMYISVLERTREIGLMKALGMSRLSVSALFMTEATWIGFLGAALGSGFAFLLGTVLNPTISEKLSFGSERLLIFVWWQMALVILFLMLVTTIAGLLPARKASKLDPIEALRTE